MPELSPLTIQDKNLVQSWLRAYPPPISELTFTNLFVWRHSRPVWTVEKAGTLVVLSAERSRPDSAMIILGGPIGGSAASGMAAVITELGSRITGAERIPEQHRLALIRAGFTLAPDPDNADYLYRVADLAELSGRRWAKKRNHIKQCLNSHHCLYEPIDQRNLEECLAAQEHWCRERGCAGNIGLSDESRAIRELFTHYQSLGVTGGAIRVEGRIQAFAVAEELSPGIAVCHFEKAAPEIEGLAQLINHWFAKFGLSGFTLVNREQDMGSAGLRQAKASYYPLAMVPKYRGWR